MNFDISGQTYSSLVGIFSAVMGLSYPLLLQAISHIDEKYHVARFVDLFKKEKAYERFSRILLLSIVFAVVAPFALYVMCDILWMQIVVLVVHTFVVLGLLLCAVKLYTLIMVYDSPQHLQEHLVKNLGNCLLELVGLAKYAAEKENDGLYRSCMQRVYSQWAEDEKQGKETRTVQEEALVKLLEFSYRKDTPLLMKKDHGVFGLLFDPRTKGFSDFKYTCVWRAVTQVTRNGEKYWMYRYWEFADQYYRDKFAYSEKSEEAQRFFEFHVAVGGLLALSGRDKWIDHVASFSSCLPPKYFLIPSTFSEIFNCQQYFSGMLDSMVELDVRYRLYDELEGVRSGARLYRGIVRYLALMMCRLPQMDFNVRYEDPMSLPHVYGDAQDEKKDFVDVNQSNIQLAEFLKKTVEELDERAGSGKEQAIGLLDGYIAECNNKLQVHSHVDQNKITRIASNLLSEFARQNSDLISRNDSDLVHIKKDTWFAESSAILNDYDLLEGRDCININRESLLVGRMLNGIRVRYNEALDAYQPIRTFLVRYRDLKEALDKLNLMNGYVVLVGSIGTHLLPQSYQNHPNVHFTYSRQPELLVMRKESLPFVCFEEKAEDEKEYKQVDARENKFLYSNIWKMQDNGEEKKKTEEKKHFKLNIGCWVSLCLPSGRDLRCVRIKAVDSITQDVFDLDEIEDVREYGL